MPSRVPPPPRAKSQSRHTNNTVSYTKIPPPPTGAHASAARIQAYHFAEADPFRATTHNKGIMNAISSVALACGQDWRAIESGAHSYASHERTYGSLTEWSKDGDGNLVGSIELPMAVGLVGGAVRVQPAAQANVALLGVESADELAKVMAAS